MSSTPPGKLTLPPPPTPSELLRGNSAIVTDSPSNSPSNLLGSVPGPRARRRSVRPSFSTRRGEDEDEALKLPTLVPGIRPAYSTPLPTLPMVVLCIAMLSELLSANLCTPFLLKMVEGFFLADGRPKDSETEAAVGLWTGNLVSVFFITQFFTSLLWSGIADRHGRRAVLVASMAGSAIALLIFGTSESLPEAICVRLVQGIFGGAVGVFRGSIRDITDDTNATRAYAVLGFSWGFGGVMGPILGGVFESPAENFRGSIGRIALFSSFPYLLPTLLGACILTVGATMACFLSWDGGVRGGSRIALAVEKDEPLAPRSPAPSTVVGHAEPPSPIEESPGPSGNTPNPRRESLASLGTAYGYGGIRSKHPTLAARAALESARRVSAAVPREDNEEVEELNFAKKLLLANEENTFNINDLWVSAAVAQDTAVFDEDEEETPAPTPGSHAEGSARRMTRNRIASGPFYRSLPGHRLSTSQNRRFSTSSGTLPAIFGNTGLNTPPAATDDPFLSPGLGVINEAPDLSEETARPSTIKSLPIMMIVQYGLVALHNTTHDQIFLSFLVTPYRSGGVGLNPANFSLLIALMCLFQLLYQFWLYPRLGPPLGRFTHLQMFRLGCCLYIPAYLALPLVHSIVSPDSSGGVIVMTVITLITAVRYCGGTLAYTSVMVLINAMSPPHVVGLANGLAQSTVSFSRFFGPVIGGAVWSASINGNPSGYATGFYIVTIGCIIQLSLSFLIR